MTDPRVVAQRLDWLETAFRVVLDGAATEELHRVCSTRAAVHGDGAPFAWNGWRGTVKRDALSRFVLTSPAERLIIWPKATGADPASHEPGWTVKVEQSGLTCLALGRRGALRNAWGCAARFGVPLRSRRRRIDAAVDVASGAYSYADLGGFVTRSKRAAALERGDLPTETPDDVPALIERLKREHKDQTARTRALVKKLPRLAKRFASDPRSFARAVQADGAARVADADRKSTVHAIGTHVETIAIGRGGDISWRGYDKLAELAHHTKTFRRNAEKEIWTRGGWTLGESIFRNEFQVRGEAMKELGLRDGAAVFDVEPRVAAWLRAFGEGEIDTMPAYDRRAELAAACADADADKLDEQLDGMWQYLTAKWLRLTVVGSASRKERGRVDPRWRALNEARWVKEAPPLGRVRNSEGASAALVIGSMTGLLARTGKLPPFMVPDEHGELHRGKPKELSARVRDGDRKKLLGKWLKKWTQLVLPILENALTEKGDAIVYLAELAELKRAKYARRVTYYPEPSEEKSA